MVRVRRGAFCDRYVWDGLDDRERHLMRVFAVAEQSPHVVLSHWSAAAVHGIATLLPLPTEVSITTDQSTGGRSTPGSGGIAPGSPSRISRASASSP